MVLRTIEKYEILEEIGHGGMATVFRARDTKLDRAVALKVMHPHLRASKEARARFHREAQGVARLKHPRVLEIYDYSGEDSEESYIATELLTGPTLKKFADDHAPIPAELAACFGIEVCRALTAAHAKGIVHRDVKPENILLHRDAESGEWCVKLTDFGIADMVDSHTMTATGQILGSPGHMSPEQIEGKDCDARTDVFSLGTVLYFLACGRLPFTGRNPHQVLKRIVDGEFADPQRVQPAIGGRLRAIIVRALAHDPGDRHASAAHLEKELRAFVAAIGIDDPEAALGRYLADPVAVAKEIQAATIPAYVAIGKKARDAGDVPGALDAFNRVLALDGENAEVLSLVESVGRATRRRSAAGWAVLAMGIVAIGSGAWMLLGPGPGPGPGNGIGEIAAAPSDAGPRDEVADAGVLDAGIALAEPGESDAGPDAAPVVSIAVVAAPPDAGLRMTTPTRVRRDAATAARGEPRFVRFDFFPANVEISVDRESFRAWGPEFPGTLLTTGEVHTFTVRTPDGVECCRPLTFQQMIPSGEGELRLPRRTLESRPASLIVRSHVPGDVIVGNGIARGRTNDPILVPITDQGARRESFTYTVTAEGRREYTGRVELAAGMLTTENVTLQEAAGPPG